MFEWIDISYNPERHRSALGYQRSTSPRPSPQRGEGVRRRNSQQSTINHQLTVTPDFIFRKSLTAIFVDGCFWHGCPKHATKPKNNRVFWQRKLSANKRRDRVVNQTLRSANWLVIRIWEHELARKNQPRLLRRIELAPGKV